MRAAARRIQICSNHTRVLIQDGPSSHLVQCLDQGRGSSSQLDHRTQPLELQEENEMKKK